MTDSELIREAAVIRDEQDQYANTAERVGTALVHMAEHITEREQTGRKPDLKLAQLDNPLGFATFQEWVQGLRGEQSYTFRLVSNAGRCIGHVWLHNDRDYPTNATQCSRLMEVVMCAATINADTGALTLNAVNGSPRIYYRTYVLPMSGGSPDGGNPGVSKWSKWQEYREYVTEPLRTAVATLQDDVAAAATTANEAAEAVSEMQGNIDAVAASIPTGVLNLGALADEAAILARCAQYAVCSSPFIVLITALYPVGEQMQSLVVQQQVTKNSDGSGVCMQYVYKGKARYTRYLNFNSAGRVTSVQPLQLDGVRSITHESDGTGTRLVLKDMYGSEIGRTTNLPFQVVYTGHYGSVWEYFNAISVDQYTKNKAIRIMCCTYGEYSNCALTIQNSYTNSSNQHLIVAQYTYYGQERSRREIEYDGDGKKIRQDNPTWDVLNNMRLDIAASKLTLLTSGGNYIQEIAWPNKNALREGTPTLTTVPLILTKSITGTAECVLNAATTARAGLMTAAQVSQLADIEARLAALEAK